MQNRVLGCRTEKKKKKFRRNSKLKPVELAKNVAPAKLCSVACANEILHAAAHLGTGNNEDRFQIKSIQAEKVTFVTCGLHLAYYVALVALAHVYHANKTL